MMPGRSPLMDALSGYLPAGTGAALRRSRRNIFDREEML
jgi:hypothetical protein